MPTPVSLANAGRKLLGPPEAYGRRKELQVKQWLLQVLPTKDEEPVDVAEAQTPSLTGSLFELFKDLRDSTDFSNALDGQICSPGTAIPGKGGGGYVPEEQQVVSGCPVLVQEPLQGIQDVATSGPYHIRQQGAEVVSGGAPDNDTSGSQDIIQQPAGADDSDGHSPPLLGPPAAAPLEFLDETDVSAADSHQRSVAVAAGLLLARTSVGLPEGTSEIDQLKAALLALVGRNKDLQKQLVDREEELRLEQDALQQRCTRAEQEAARVREEALALRQQVTLERTQLEDEREEYQLQIRQLQHELATANNRMEEQAAEAVRVRQDLHQQHLTKEQQVKALQREVTRVTTDSRLAVSRLQTQIVDMRQQLEEQKQQVFEMAVERDRLTEICEREVALRMRAEESELRALAAAASQLELHEATRRAQEGQARAQRQSTKMISCQTAVKEVDPVRVLANMAGGTVRGAAGTQDKGTARRPATPQDQTSSLPNGPSPSMVPPQSPCSPLQHRTLQKAVLNERRALGEALRNERMAVTKAQVAEAKMVQEALACAPDHLRQLGVAFRVYLVGAATSKSSLLTPLATLLAPTYRTFFDPDLGVTSSVDPLAIQRPVLVGLSVAVVLIAERGILDLPHVCAELSEACTHHCRLAIVVQDEDLLLADLTSRESLPLDVVEQQYLQQAWDSRVSCPSVGATTCQLDPLHPEPSLLAAALPRLSVMLGLPDPLLQHFPLDALRKLSKGGKVNSMPDLTTLNGLTSLRLDLGHFAAPQPHADHPHDHLCSRCSLGCWLGHILQVNTTMRSLTIRGATPLLVDDILPGLLSPSCLLSNIILNSLIPIAALFGREGEVPLDTLDLRASGPLALEDTLLLGALLPHASSLTSLTTGPLDHLGTGAAEKLANAVLAMSQLRAFNGVPLNITMLCTQQATESELADQGQGRALDLSGHALGHVGMAVIHRWCQTADLSNQQKLSAFTSINLTGCHLKTAGAQVLGGFLSLCNLTVLRELRLANNSMGPEGMHSLCVAFSRVADKPESGLPLALDTLDLSGNELGDTGCQVLHHHLPSLPSLTHLSLASNAIQADGLRQLAAKLEALPALARLDLRGNHVADAGVLHLCTRLSHMSSLTSLQLNHNHSLGVEAARAMGAALHANCTLRVLDLGNNALKPEGARQLALGLSANSFLEVLSLVKCQLRSEGAQHLGDMLKTNGHLRELYLNRNSLGDKGVKALCDGLRKNRSLVILDLQHNSIGLTGSQILAKTLEGANTTLTRVSLQGNEVDEDIVTGLERLAARTRSCINTPTCEGNSSVGASKKFVRDTAIPGTASGASTDSALLRLAACPVQQVTRPPSAGKSSGIGKKGAIEQDIEPKSRILRVASKGGSSGCVLPIKYGTPSGGVDDKDATTTGTNISFAAGCLVSEGGCASAAPGWGEVHTPDGVPPTAGSTPPTSIGPGLRTEVDGGGGGSEGSEDLQTLLARYRR